MENINEVTQKLPEEPRLCCRVSFKKINTKNQLDTAVLAACEVLRIYIAK